MPINYYIEQFPIDAEALSNWGSADIGTTVSYLSNGLPMYGLETGDGYIDNGLVPLKFHIYPIDTLTHAVRATDFTLSDQAPDAIVTQNPNVTNGYRYTNPNVLPQNITRVEFWDRYSPTPLNPNNFVVVYAWLDPNTTVGMLDQEIVLDIDGDAQEYATVPEGTYTSLESNFNEIPEGATATLTLTTSGLDEGTTVMFSITGDITPSDIELSPDNAPNNLDVYNQTYGAIVLEIVGEVEINYNGGGTQVTTFPVTAALDNNLELPENAVIQLFNYDSNGVPTGALSEIIQIIDTTEPLVGCMDSQALNYDPLANIQCDGSNYYTTPSGEIVDGTSVPCINNVFDDPQTGSGCCCEQYVSPPDTCCMDPIALNYDENCIYACTGSWCCTYGNTWAKFYFVNDFEENYDITPITNMDFPYYTATPFPNASQNQAAYEFGGETYSFPGVNQTETHMPPVDVGVPYATKREKLGPSPMNVRFVKGALGYHNINANGFLPVSTRSRFGLQGYAATYSTANWWDGTPGVEKVFGKIGDYQCNQSDSTQGPWTGWFSTCLDWEMVPRNLGEMWDGFGGFYIRPKDGYSVSRHNFAIACERIRFGYELSSRAAADGYDGQAKIMCCGSESISNHNGTSNGSVNGERFFQFTEGYNQSELAEQFNQYCCSDEGPNTGEINYNTWQDQTAEINKSYPYFYNTASDSFTSGGVAWQNPRIRVEKTVYINPWVYVSPDAFPDLEPLDRKNIGTDGLENSLDGAPIWYEHPINNIFAAIEIWDMKPLDTWNWCENLYDPPQPQDEDFIPGTELLSPFGSWDDNSYFGQPSCCSWEDPNIHNLIHIGVNDNYDTSGSPIAGGAGNNYDINGNCADGTPAEDTNGDGFDDCIGNGWAIPNYNPSYGSWALGSSAGTAPPYWGCNKGDLPYIHKSYLCGSSAWWWDFQEGGNSLEQLYDIVNPSASSQINNIQESIFCAPEGSVNDAGMSCSGLKAYGYIPFVDGDNNYVQTYTGQLPIDCGVMNNWDGSSSENSSYNENINSLGEKVTNDYRYFQNRFMQPLSSNANANIAGLINPGDYNGNYLYIKAVRRVDFGSCGTFEPQVNWPSPQPGARFFVKINGSPMECSDCEPSEEFFFEIETQEN